ncbi:LPXTG cell wall anchor domain-containing protein, partial [Levilactobacillus suantsaii]
PLTFITSQTAADQPAPTTDHISFPTPVVASQGSSADKALPQTGDRQNKQLSLVGLGLLLGLSVGGWWLRRRRQS